MRGELRQRLKTEPGVRALCAGRVEWLRRPQGGSLPAVTLQVITAPRGQTMTGPDRTVAARVQIDCWATSYEAAFNLAQAVDLALRDLTGPPFISGWSLIDEGEAVEDLAAPKGPAGATAVHRNRRDYRVLYREA